MILKKCDVKFGNFHCKVLALTPKAEHFFVGAYASAEVIGAHVTMWYFSVGLAAAVAGSFIYDKLTAGEVA